MEGKRNKKQEYEQLELFSINKKEQYLADLASLCGRCSRKQHTVSKEHQGP